MIGIIKNIQLRKIWNKGYPDFTSWLSEHLNDIGDAIHLKLKFVAKEIPLGPFCVDILAKDKKTDKFVVVVNQLESTDYEHLGKFITYASVLNASSVIWITSNFSDEHKKALDWLNDHTSDEINFYGVKIEVWQIENSQPAVRFNVISQPNSAVRQTKSRYNNESDTKLASKELEAYELQNSLDKANAIVKLSCDGQILSVNKLFCDMLEYEPDELLQKDYSFLIPGIEMQKNFKNCLEKSKKGENQKEEFVTRTKGGQEKFIESSLFPVYSKDNKFQFILKIANDITDKIRHQKDLEQRKQEAEKALVAKDNFLCNMSHEIRTPLNAIIGFSDLLRKEDLNASQFEYVDTILRAGESLLYIVNDILDLSKIESGNFSLEKKLFSPEKVLEYVYNMQKDKASKKGVSLEKEINGVLPELVLGDEYRLSQIIINLVNNAIKFTHEGFVKICASAELVANNKSVLSIKVQDSGIGIPEDKQQMIFQRFTQAETDTTRKYGGTGLGLNIVKLLVDNFNGSLKLKSKIGEGSVFSVSIPFELEKKSKENNQSSDSQCRHKQSKILMFEDNPLNQKLVQKIIVELGHELIVVSNGYEGVEWLKNNESVDLILMDLVMPGMDGFEATSIIREKLKINTPIIAMTAHSLSQEKAKCIEFGMNGFLSKPFKLEVLVSKVQTALNNEKQSISMSDESAEKKPGKLPDLEDLKLLGSRKDLLKKYQVSSLMKRQEN